MMILIASTRPGRIGLPVAEWFEGVARYHGGFDIDVVDLAELNLPFMDEPNHPRFRAYVHEHTKRWSERVDAADTIVFAMPEYNYAFNAPLKNAIDYLHQEWAYKPLGLVTYGGVSAGTRAAQMVKQVVSALRMVPAGEAVSIPFVRQFLSDEGRIEPNETINDAANAMLDELARLSVALRPLREREPATV